ncbi:putative tail fiber adhesin protein [Rhizobium phage RHph_Y68]|uniref:Putative tail fiber adhesin protein n=1 Tax=Rhizobium phage RHph_Y68 TaxID=2509787 RepID=A0A7S5QXS9_9CAUD|nr:putative tail fiber adhesin protein [Rhizobium phage RHph_Y68]QIG67947.1 putative tail fiber adhesin protein [Rhizobium phage RHph_Y68]
MTLPTAGPISLDDVATEFSLSTPVSMSDLYGLAVGIPISGEISLSMFRGKGVNIEKIISTSVQNLSLSSLFTNEELNSSFDKKVFIDPGVTIGSLDPSIPAMRSGVFLGDLIIENHGNIFGAGGAGGTNGSAGSSGGDAILLDIPGVVIDNYGFIRGGGGGGGSGGIGGEGGDGVYSFIHREPKIGNYYSRSAPKFYVYEYRFNGILGNVQWFWNDVQISSAFSNDYIQIGEIRYYKGEQRAYQRKENVASSVQEYTYYAIHQEYPISYGTEGGAGGDYKGAFSDGGHGQGYLVSSTSGKQGFAGEPGGTNAGKGGDGGTGGNGGTWGAPGSAGAAGKDGTNGNVSDGTVGQPGFPGGSAGRAITSNQIYTVNNFGTIDGSY